MWKWRKGTATTADFGQPVTGSTTYALCIYDDNALVMTAVIPPGGVCAGEPCWRAIRGSGYTHSNSAATGEGVSQVSLRSGTGHARVVVKGAGANLALPLPFTQASAVTVQLVNNAAPGSQCWSAIFVPPAKKTATNHLRYRIP